MQVSDLMQYVGLTSESLEQRKHSIIDGEVNISRDLKAKCMIKSCISGRWSLSV
jgi:hypothetical protein